MAVRRVLRTQAFAFATTPPPPQRVLRTQSFPFNFTARGTMLAHRAFVPHGDKLVLDIDPTAFARAQFERAGVYRESALDLVYGVGEGFVEYRFVAPMELPRAVSIEARVSSELPGAGSGNDPRDGNDIEIALDGEVIGTVWAKPDDGLGDVVHVELSDSVVVERLFRKTRRHVLTLRSLPSRYAGGLCVYGKPTGRVALEPNQKRSIDSVRVTLSAR
jgi:hypothetical protein